MADSLLTGFPGILILGVVVKALYWNSESVAATPQPVVGLTVEAVASGNDTLGVTVDATMETGLTIRAPGFVNVGDTLHIDSRQLTYLGRVPDNRRV